MLGGLDDEDEADEMNREAFGGATMSEVEAQFAGEDFFGRSLAGPASQMLSLEEVEAGDGPRVDFASLEDIEASIMSCASKLPFHSHAHIHWGAISCSSFWPNK